MTEKPPIVVGLDGSEASLAAARWAAEEARLRNCPLQLVHTYLIPVLAQPVIAPYNWTQIFDQEAEAVFSQAHEAIGDAAGDVPLSTHVSVGDPAGVLTELSRTATMMVVGHRGEGGFPALGLGSVAWKVAAHADSPVVIVRPGALPVRTAPVVVGVDGSERNHAAVQFAFEQAGLRSVPLEAVHAWRPPLTPRRAEVTFDHAELETAARLELRRWLAPWQERFPQVPTKLRLRSDHPANCLVEAGREAGLLVVGSRGRGGFSRLLLGSVSHQVIQHATCPVAVLR